MRGHARLDVLRRRVDDDPASVAFAQLAEEYRRAGEHEEAVRVGRAGLEHHPNYLSARVTLGRALTEMGRYAEARAELEHVVAVAPDNLAAIRGLADLHQRLGVDEEAAPPAPTSPAAEPPRATGPADPGRSAPAWESLDLNLPGGRVEDSEFWSGATADGADQPRAGSVLGLSVGHRRRPAQAAPPDPPPPLPPPDAALEPLERWLASVRADRAARAGVRPAR